MIMFRDKSDMIHRRQSKPYLEKKVSNQNDLVVNSGSQVQIIKRDLRNQKS